MKHETIRRAAVILTNLLYAVAGIATLLLGETMLHAALAIALGLLTGGSWRFHETLRKADLTLDRLGMMFVGATRLPFTPPPEAMLYGGSSGRSL